MGGGLCAVLEGKVLSEVSLPVAGLLTEEPVDVLTQSFEDFFQAVKTLRLEHENPMMFLTLMSLAVSPEIKCTDLGLVDVLEKKFIPLIVSTE
jgi:adenine deaminase